MFESYCFFAFLKGNENLDYSLKTIKIVLRIFKDYFERTIGNRECFQVLSKPQLRIFVDFEEFLELEPWSSKGIKDSNCNEYLSNEYFSGTMRASVGYNHGIFFKNNWGLNVGL